MTKSSKSINIYLEVGKKRTFAAAMEWPGWCRMGRDEESAIQALFEYAPRYARILRNARLGFTNPRDVSTLVVVETLKGNATTDFGAPALPPASDKAPMSDVEVRRLQAILKACWRALDVAVQKAKGKKLSTGPRGGGRTLKGVFEHVQGAETGYLSSLGGKVQSTKTKQPSKEEIREAILNTLMDSAHGEIAKRGPRGGVRWSPRYFVRREAWHVLDHVWEIEDRIV